MRKSSSSNISGVKVNAKQREQLLDLLRPNIKAIIKNGVDQYIGSGTKFMLKCNNARPRFCGGNEPTRSRPVSSHAALFGLDTGTPLRGIHRRAACAAGVETSTNTFKQPHRSLANR
jgi:hypothetical protein